MMSSCTRKKLFAYLGIWLLVACFFLLDIHFGENTSATGGVFSIHFDCDCRSDILLRHRSWWLGDCPQVG